MDYLKHKYTRTYFLNRDVKGKPVGYGAVGTADFLMGDIRPQDKDILKRVNFNGKTVLDIGFGRGEAIKFAYEHGAKKIIGIDYSKAACSLAAKYLKSYGIPARLYCQDIVRFLKQNKKDTIYDIVILLDVVEHIPRDDLKVVLRKLKKYLSSKALLVVNTPVFPVDNDGYKEGINQKDYEDSDDIEETRGMHINRYTKQSLISFMKSLGYYPATGHYFITHQIPFAKAFCSFLGYPLRFPQILAPESYEYAYSRKFGKQPGTTIFHKIFRKLNFLKPARIETKPKNVRVISGPLCGKYLLLDLYKGDFWQDMVLGTYDHFIYEWLQKNFDLNNKVFWDIGAHIGYHSLCFASLMGEKGKVVAVEPNKFNLARFRANLKLNPKLKKKIALFHGALSDRRGIEKLIFTDAVDDTRSSGSHLGNILPPEKPEVYQGFTKTRVKTFTLDNLISTKFPAPDVLKIDVEGAEALVLRGAEKLLSRHKPVLFIEVHNITQMFAVSQILTRKNYRLKILDDAGGSLSRCFIIARKT